MSEALSPTNETLFWDAFSGHTSTELLDIGGTIDERVGLLLDELHAESVSEGASSLDKGRELTALQIAQHAVDHSYGRMTGYKRNGGCNMGRPVTYRDSLACF